MFQLPVESDSDAACPVGGKGKEQEAQELNLPLSCPVHTCAVQCTPKHIGWGPEVWWMQGVQDRKSM